MSVNSHHHDHTNAPSADSKNSTGKRLLAAFIVTAVFMLAEAIGGIISGSLALLADAGHMLTDAAALLLAFLAVRFAQRAPNKKFTFGYLRLTTLAAFLNAAALIVIVIFIFWEAINRFFEPQPVMGKTMLYIAIAGLFANIFAFWLLHRGGGVKNINVRAAALHVLGDMLGSIGAIVAALVIMRTNWTPIDPILSVLVSCLVLRSAWRLLKESFHELLEGSPLNISISEVENKLCQHISEVRNIHHVHLWQVGEQKVMTLHAQVQALPKDNTLLQRIQAFLLEQYQLGHVTIQLEYGKCANEACELNNIPEPQIHTHQHGHSHH